ncbi:MAG: hypothetical protein II687_04125 [Selenomonadaceae bacterium]|nr:hypothetical protein [Selenomonadaceae bacterium]
MKHCKQDFKPFDIWYLYDNKGFYDRLLKLGKCQVCKKPIAELRETRKEDDVIFTQFEVGSEAERLAEINRNSVNYSRISVDIFLNPAPSRKIMHFVRFFYASPFKKNAFLLYFLYA